MEIKDQIEFTDLIGKVGEKQNQGMSKIYEEFQNSTVSDTNTAKIAIQCLNKVMNNGQGLQFIVFLIIADAEVETSISDQ